MVSEKKKLWDVHKGKKASMKTKSFFHATNDHAKTISTPQKNLMSCIL